MRIHHLMNLVLIFTISLVISQATLAVTPIMELQAITPHQSTYIVVEQSNNDFTLTKRLPGIPLETQKVDAKFTQELTQALQQIKTLRNKTNVPVKSCEGRYFALKFLVKKSKTEIIECFHSASLLSKKIKSLQTTLLAY